MIDARAEGAASYLDIYLEPLADYLSREDVTDLYVNRPGEVWVEAPGKAATRHLVPELTEALLWRLARQVASLTHQGISREHPLLSARLPDGTRIQFVAPPATRGPMIIALRKHRTASLSLADYGIAGAFADTTGDDVSPQADIDLRALCDCGDWQSFLCAAVRARKTIMVSGGTSSGKTTFLNALIGEIGRDERLVTIEDTAELSLPNANVAGLIAVRGELGEANISPDDLLTASLRLRPDRILLGELRGPEAFTFLRAVNTGHPGSMTTIHADTPSGAIEQLVLLALQARMGLSRDDILAYARSVIDIIVQLDRHGGKRRISAVRWLKPDMLGHA